ncbi:hypothetical protein [Rathayibacter iranicus]|uniref:Uncharacterized protein n=1 Tax=Rathayibacter iranicus TaxID=59737 RepID=A0AAD1EMY2_9MICO|nr:hypothetical protein [Rathayibacter iranicus]AZZ56652.1 hypothetical protein C7V51_12790 [Rathayibacter iranicus]MWV31312.1 hypothetical protein [Rathayibacter iranicus NCPPB 2253 = VKM Ac-1602]PPI43297.1 hypothetical protein C5E09_11710 [Rathayibacter iranicus]PPI58240.1 hypothetical protein C5E08_12625 [Rathayibacter iranicus]PPI69453.1 hypothetical protein C5E01_11670 [Rathayibacter iranicus]
MGEFLSTRTHPLRRRPPPASAGGLAEIDPEEESGEPAVACWRVPPRSYDRLFAPTRPIAAGQVSSALSRLTRDEVNSLL